ncbi:FadR/GntR family transcriptional regulator [uncultured Cohaesibacter sp.]|uniref:FadR/GntR family transcriptional regulator n=1 Tax=uncultured Cohaesibacter sp. TaxID=1002546 RepID=UPI00292F55CB|nr:FadR/GntR family transcriptional regulator [uncultured Cohaesibacter sp.]
MSKELETTTIPEMPLRRGRLHTAVSAVLESRILNGELKVGDRLESESAIAREFGVSTRAVREAIQELEVKGLVQRRHGERTEVVREDVNSYLDALAVTVRQQFYSDPDYLLQLMTVRRMIESEVLEILTDGELPEMPKVDEALESMKMARDEKDFAGFVDADAAFHLALVHATNNQILMHIYDNFSGLINDVIHVTSRVPIKSLRDAYEEHEEIYDLICQRNKTGAMERIRAQIDNSADYLRQAIEQSNLKQAKKEDENG